MTKQIFILLLLLVSFSNAFAAAVATTFGAEFTFTSEKVRRAVPRDESHIVNSAAVVTVQLAMVENVKHSCGECRIEKVLNGYDVETYRVTYPDGWYFVIATDPSVVEVQTKPSTVADIEAHLGVMQRDIFEAAKKAGVEPELSMGTGGGHVHFDYRSSVGGQLLRLRNLLVDFANHSETAQGIWASDYANSPPIAELPDQNREKFVRLIDDVDRGAVTTISEFVSRLKSQVYNYSQWGWDPADKYQAINVNRINNRSFPLAEKTIEVRALRPEKDAREYLTVIKILEGRIQYLKAQTKPIPLQLPRRLGYPFPSPDMLKKHLQYVRESGVTIPEYLQTYSLNPRVLETLKLTGYSPQGYLYCKKVWTYR